MAGRAVTAALLALLLGACTATTAQAAIYWSAGGSIERVNSDGSYRSDRPELSRFFTGQWIPSTGEVCALGVDAGHIYWGSRSANAIGRANLDGTNPEYAFVAGANEPCALTVDGSHLYWANGGGTTIGRANLDGTGVDQGFVELGTHPCGLAVDGAHLYWADFGDESIGRV